MPLLRNFRRIIMDTSSNKKRAVLITALCSLVYFVSYFARKDFAASLAGMLEAGVVDKTLGGFINMALFICYGIGQLISGYLGDKFKPRTIISAGLLATAVCNLTLPLANGWVMIPIWAVNGLAQAMLWPPIVKILSCELDNDAFVKANLYVTAAAHVSTVLLYLYVPLCLKIASWQLAFITAGALSAVVLIIFTLVMWKTLTDSAPSPTSVKKAVSDTAFFPIARKAGIIPILLGIVMMGFLRDGIETWLPTLYSEAFGKGAEESTLLSIILPIFAIICILLITKLHKFPLFQNEVRGAGILFSIAAVLGIPLSILIETDGGVSNFVCLFLAALITGLMHGVNFLLISCLPGRFAKCGRSSTASGITNACVYIGAALSMYGIPAISSALGLSFTVISWIAISVLGIIFSCISLRKYSDFLTK